MERIARHRPSLLLVLAFIASGCGGFGADRDTPEVGVTKQAATIDFDESYVVMGVKSVAVKQYAEVLSGNVGVSFDSTRYPVAGMPCLGDNNPSDCYVGAQGSALHFFDRVDADQGSKLFGDTVRLNAYGTATAVYHRGTFTRGANTMVGTVTQVDSTFFPLFPSLPTPQIADPGGNSEGSSAPMITVPLNGTLCLEPGTHPSIKVSQNAQLTFAADCDSPNATTPGTYAIRDLVVDRNGRVTFGPGDYRMRDVQLARDAPVLFPEGTMHVRNFLASDYATPVFGGGTYHFRNFRMGNYVTTKFRASQGASLRVQNKLRLGSQNQFNSIGYESGEPADPSLVRIYVNGTDGSNALDDMTYPAQTDRYPAAPRAVSINTYTQVRANIMALGQNGAEGGTIRIESYCVAIGSFFADHVVIGTYVDLTNRNGIAGAGSADPSYLDGDSDNDGVPNISDKCMTIPDVAQLDTNADGIGDACDNCPNVANPVQEPAASGSAGAACAVPPEPYCGDGVLQASNGEECDYGFPSHGDSEPCSLACEQNLPVITAQPQSQTALVGTDVTFSVTATGTGLSYQWRKDGAPVSGATSASLTLPAVSHDDAGAYDCVISNFAGAATSAAATLDVVDCLVGAYVPIATSCGVGACASTGTTSCVDGVVHDSCAPGTPGPSDASCDDIDNDCDGTRDEDYAPVATSCGVGACAREGSTSCVSGNVVDGCDPGEPAASDATCDGADDDCDGAIDDDYVSVATSCGVGACTDTGATSCVDGAVVDSCDPGPAAANDTLCDGIDSDCNGLVDDGFVPEATSCGVGACGSTGVTSCVAGELQDSCTTGMPAGSDATCNGVDNDCDGASDEGYQPIATSCGVGACGSTGSTSCSSGTVIDSCTPGVPAASDASCNAIDEDCDGASDEGYQPIATSCGVGACGSTGVTSCTNGIIADSCAPGVPAASDATCDGVDDDCNGEPDEDYAPVATTCGVGACGSTGATSCLSGAVQDSCEPGEPGGADATCNGIDEDCDGEVDEAYASVATTCGVGACAATGATSCAGGTVVDSCDAGAPAPGDASCDGTDDDCDGAADEDYVPLATSCGVGACAATGVTACVAGAVTDSCVAGAPGSDASCNGIDNDCDGETDEAYAPVATSCGVGACASEGVTSCVLGEVHDSCAPGVAAPNDASCNASDDDCNGATDEDYVSLATSCGQGACGDSGATSCVAGEVIDSCEPGTPGANDETCDGIDNDCNGVVDDGYQPVATSCGVGACAANGMTACVGADVLDSCTAGTPAASDATCDDIDDDCDGTRDEDYAALPTSCGVGACASSGSTSCVAGTVADSCAPGAPELDDATCNGIDDDCDGTTDEDYAPVATSCGVGACVATGVTSCVSGSVQDSCDPGEPAASDATCNGVDDDCSGAADEDYAPVATSCGVGACAATGETSCVNGSVADSCDPGAPAADDRTCDATDDDCDGAIDESYIPVPTSCGVGACGAQGVTSCAAGVVGDSCEPGEPAPNDASCNGVDDDCNGAVDDDYVPRTTSCGVGACGSTGVTSCVAGSERDSCEPDEPGPSDASCNGVDEDCDGEVDEDYAPLATSCGVGACGSTGVTACIGGAVQDNCQPGAAAPSDASCDGVDSDCNGAVDEDYVVSVTSCGTGACAATGLAHCIEGAIADTCEAGAPTSDANCDAIDNDCNGIVDEDYAVTATSCGVGACAGEGVTSCVDGEVQDSCEPGIALPTDGTCDAVDDDCNGSTDEDYAPQATTCGQGACSESGATSCVAGVVQDSCEPGTPGANDETCDGIDNDCNGAIDDGYQPVATSCGVGACGRAGMTACIGGELLDSCESGAPAASDATCDDIDDDCDGTRDEDYAALPTGCGVGACASTGSTSCVAGAVVDSCTTGTPAIDDADCDNVDDDCSGEADEDYPVIVTSCGVGACARTGTMTCSAGVEQDSCAPGTPAASDATCNDVDDDCNGTRDEDYVGQPTSCGVGPCAASGVSSCVGGTVQANCTPGAPPATQDVTCDGIDDDCSGAADEDFVVACQGSLIVACNAGVPSTTECSNGNACDGAETCSAATCQPGTPPVIDDGSPCTVDSCSPLTGVTHTPVERGTSCGSPGQVCDAAGACVSETAPAILSGPANVTASVGQDALFSVTASGGNLNYEWRLFGQPIANSNGATYARPAVVLGDHGGVYSVRVWNSAGEVTSGDATLSVLDDVGPEIELSGPATFSTSADFAAIAGYARDAGTGVARVEVRSARYGGQAFDATLDAPTGAFSAEVPLELGDNALTVAAFDAANNQSTRAVLVTVVVDNAPRLVVTAPANGAVVMTETIDVSGVVRTTLPRSDLRVVLGSLVEFPTGADGEYAFTFDDVRLTAGGNTLAVRLETPFGQVTRTITVIYQPEAPAQPSLTPPQITARASGSEVFVSGATVPVAGTVTAQRCVDSVTVNGVGANLVGSGTTRSFSADIAFPLAQESLPITIVARDCDAQTATLTYTARHDLVEPVLTVNGLALADTVNPASHTPYGVTGTVTESRLAGFSVDDQSVGLLPAGGDNWTFAFDVPLARNTPRTLTIAAWDHAGNRTEQRVILELQSALTVEIVAPSDNAQFLSQGGASQLDVTARIPGLASGDQVFATVDSGTPQALTVAGSTANGTVNAGSGSHTLTVSVRSSEGAQLASASHRFTVTDADDVALGVLSSQPTSGAVGVEGNTPVFLTLTKPVADPTLLSATVRETVHARLYQQDGAGRDVSTLQEPKLREVNRDREPIPGVLELLPDGVSAIFTPSRDFEYGGRIEVDVSYADASIGRFEFYVRPLPTMVRGFITDHLRNPLRGIAVSIPALSRTTVSDEEGAFGFGFGDAAENDLPPGQHRIVVNPGLRDPRFGSVERILTVQGQRLNEARILSIPVLYPNVAYSRVSSGAASAFTFDRGKLSLDLSDAALTFPNGRAEGDIHVQPMLSLELPYPQAFDSYPMRWGYSVQPSGISVEGQVDLTIALPPEFDSYEYVDSLPALALIMGLDADSLTTVPIGVGRIDKVARAIRSEGAVRLERMDVIGYAFVPADKVPVLQQYLDGEIDLDVLVGRVTVAAPGAQE